MLLLFFFFFISLPFVVNKRFSKFTGLIRVSKLAENQLKTTHSLVDLRKATIYRICTPRPVRFAITDSTKQYETDGRTDRQTDGQDRSPGSDNRFRCAHAFGCHKGPGRLIARYESVDSVRRLLPLSRHVRRNVDHARRAVFCVYRERAAVNSRRRTD